MNKKKIIALVGVLAVVGAAGFGLGATTKGAAAPAKQPPMMMQGNQMGNMDAKTMADMMNSPQMQKQCVEYMKSPEMQQAMIGTMKQPEMQAAMKQMLQRDAGFHQMMLDLVNSVDMNGDHGNMPMDSQSSNGGQSSHGMHHQ